MKEVKGQKTEYKKINNPYKGISLKDYHVEKRRLQLELLRIQESVVKNKI